MTTSTVTSKGQVTLPAFLRREFQIKPSDRVAFSKEGKRIYVEKVDVVENLFGSLSNEKVKPLTSLKMKKMIKKAMFSKNDIS